MSRFYFEPVSTCQLKCKLCPSQKFDNQRKGIMNFEKYKNFIEKCISEGYMKPGDEVHLYGFGEPTLHPMLSEMIQILTKNKIITKINTNGLALEKDLWQRLVKAGLTKCLISLDGNDEKTYQKYRVGGDYNKVITNIKNICSNHSNTKIEVQMIVFEHNFSQIENFIENVRKLGVDIVTIKKARTWDGSDKETNLLNLPEEYKRDFNSEECRFFDDFGVILQDGSLTLCTADPFGKHVVGNIFEIGPSLWYSDKFKTLKNEKKKLEICEHCGYDNLYLKKIKLK